MAAYNKFNDFVQQLAEKTHNMSADQLNVYLAATAAAPSASADAVKADIAEIAGGSGYTAGGIDTQNTGAETSGTYTLTGTKCVVTASGGSVAAFQFVVLYNLTTASDNLVSWWDYGSSLTLADGESFSIKFNNSDTTGTIFTLA